VSFSRRDFLRPFTKQDREVLLRPPYLLNSSLLESECKKCGGACATLCPEGIIKILSDGTPSIVFGTCGCTFCDECAKACKYGVLGLEGSKKIEGNCSIDITKCISWNKSICFSCKDACYYNAIDFLGMFRPTINQNCVNCGFCIDKCPSVAITIKGV